MRDVFPSSTPPGGAGRWQSLPRQAALAALLVPALALVCIPALTPAGGIRNGPEQQLLLALTLSVLAGRLAAVPLGACGSIRAAAIIVCGFGLWTGILVFLFGDFSDAGWPPRLPALALGAATLTLFWCGLQRLLERDSQSTRGAMLFPLLTAGLCLAPVYLSPLAERLGQQPAFASFVVALSPLSFLAALLEHDYLRSPWFYRNTGFGSLQFSYPAPGPAGGMYLFLALVMLWRGSTGRTPPAAPPSP